jgi:hypothetical protein
MGLQLDLILSTDKSSSWTKGKFAFVISKKFGTGANPENIFTKQQ